MSASKQFKRTASTVAAASAAAAFLMGQPAVGGVLCAVAALFGVSALHRLGRKRHAQKAQSRRLAPIPSLEQRKRMIQEMA